VADDLLPDLDTPRKAPRIALHRDITAGGAFTTIAWACLDHMAHNETVFLRTRDPEALHQLRVGARRLRSAFSLFRQILREDPQALRLKAELRAQALPLGRLRDLDVLLESVFDPETADIDPAAATMRAELLLEQKVASDEAAAILDSVAWRRLIGEITAWLHDGKWARKANHKRRDQSARRLARQSLGRFLGRVDTLGTDLAQRTPRERHQVRIEGKKLRYGSEFLGSLFPDRAVDHDDLVLALSQMQEHLGRLNDIATAREYWQRTGHDEPAWMAHDEAANLAAAVVDRDTVLATAPFWIKPTSTS
jgi:triphosphatase